MFYKKVADKILSKFTCNLIKKEIPTQVYFQEIKENFHNDLSYKIIETDLKK